MIVVLIFYKRMKIHMKQQITTIFLESLISTPQGLVFWLDKGGKNFTHVGTFIL